MGDGEPSFAHKTKRTGQPTHTTLTTQPHYIDQSITPHAPTLTLPTTQPQPARQVGSNRWEAESASRDGGRLFSSRSRGRRGSGIYMESAVPNGQSAGGDGGGKRRAVLAAGRVSGSSSWSVGLLIGGGGRTDTKVGVSTPAGATLTDGRPTHRTQITHSATGPHARILAWFDVSQHMVRVPFSR